MDKGCLAAVPSGDGAVQIGKDEASGRAIPAARYRNRKGRGVCIGDLAGGADGSDPPGGMAILPLVPAGNAFVTPLPAVTAKRVAVLVPWFEVQKGLAAL